MNAPMNAAMKTRIVDLHSGTMVVERAGRIGPSHITLTS